MNILGALLVGGLSLVATGAGDEEIILPLRYARGKVLDVFDSKQVLISIGADQGVKKGAKIELYRLEPVLFDTQRRPSLLPVLAGTIELVEVGAKHSVGRVEKLHRKQIQANDVACWTWLDYMRNLPIPERPRVPGQWERGGAIIDLTQAEVPK